MEGVLLILAHGLIGRHYVENNSSTISDGISCSGSHVSRGSRILLSSIEDIYSVYNSPRKSLTTLTSLIFGGGVGNKMGGVSRLRLTPGEYFIL